MPKSKANTTKPWAIYTYIAGDNDLSDYGLKDIQEMTDAGASKDVHVAVQIDTEGEFDGSVRYEISEPDFEGNAHRTVIDRLKEQNTGEPRYLAQFASWASKRYPAKNRLLVVWNHGAGFMHTPTRDIGYDDSSQGDALTMSELRWALESAGFGSGSKGRLSILGFDACLMNMLEVAYEYKGIADFVVGSQQTEPGDGWPYGDVVRATLNNATPQAVAAAIVKAYTAYYKKTGESGVTQSALVVDKLTATSAALDKLGAELLKIVDTQAGKILQARIKTQGYHEPTYVDAVDCAKNIAAQVSNPAVRAACTAFQKAVGQAVLTNGKYGTAVSRSCGLSLWFPLVAPDYITRRNEYAALRFTKEFPSWMAFLDRLLGI